MERQELIVGLDVGTTKVSAVVLEPGDTPKVVGVGSAPCDGLRKAVIVNPEKATAAIAAAVGEAARSAGAKIEEAIVGVGGDHLRGENSRSVVAVSRATGEIREQDMRRVMDAARAVDVPADRTVLHSIPQEFVVDGEGGVRDPLGMKGVRLEGRVHVVTAATQVVQGLVRCVRRAGVRAERVAALPYAAAHAVLRPHEVEQGIALLDIGGGSTGLALFENGAVRFTGAIPVGGNHITNDIAVGLKTPYEEAEPIKIEHGRALAGGEDATAALPVPDLGGAARVISLDLLLSIIEPRVEEMLVLAQEKIKAAELLDQLGAGVVITGGTSLLPGIAEHAERIFEMPARAGEPELWDDVPIELSDPRLAGATGLVLYGLEHDRGGRGTLVSVTSGVESISRAVNNVSGWLKDFF
jgi:cell division protein FtsA